MRVEFIFLLNNRIDMRVKFIFLLNNKINVKIIFMSSMYIYFMPCFMKIVGYLTSTKDNSDSDVDRKKS